MKTSPLRIEYTTSAISEIAFTEIKNLIYSKLTLLNYKKHIILFRAVFMLRVILTPEFHIYLFRFVSGYSSPTCESVQFLSSGFMRSKPQNSYEYKNE